ncbi:4658_t:CDS:2 [Funneliformis geosporum]|nr:4658_t:CDS:2 [Funneliformis geosporum]
MGRISSNIREGVKVSVLGSVVSESIAQTLLEELWKTKQLSARVLRVALGNNRWIIYLDSQPENKIEVSAGRIKFVAFPTTILDTNQDTNISTNNDPFHFAQQFHDEFNENLTKAILPALADAQINLFLRLDPAEPSEYAMKKKFSDQYSAIVSSMLRLIKKRRYWPKNIPNDITDILENTYGLSIRVVCKISDVDLTGYGNATFRRPIVFDEYNEFRSAVDILNNLRDNSLFYHDILGSKRFADRVLPSILQLQRQIASLHIIDLFWKKKYETR